jgi:succinate dehydrogenase / fumarate reductase membrane anchor subunit
MSGRRGAATRHWLNQRLTAVALVPLGLWFLAALLRQPALDYDTVSTWLAKPLQALLAALLGAAMLWHSMLGVEVVLEDYVHGKAFRVSLWLARFVHVAAALALAWALIRIAGPGA